MALRRRACRGKENPERLPERLGIASRERPAGELVWIHGASVGESLSVLPLIDALLAVAGRSVLVTSGTVTSAEMIESRLSPRAFHQFAPIDTPVAVARFLDHWQPAVGLFVDSEIWPNMLTAAHARGIRLAIVNGRMSDKSFAAWRNARRAAASLLSLYDVCLVQDEETARRLKTLGASSLQVTGSLKADAAILPADPEKLKELEDRAGGRPVLLAASTHPGEEKTILAACDILRGQFPSLLTIVVPRHPARGIAIEELCAPRISARRSRGELPAKDTNVYIADTMGELGLFYRLVPFAFIGGSLVPHGGQNPLEAARLGAAVLAGPHTDNFRQIYETIFARQKLGRVASAAELSVLVARLLGRPQFARELGAAAADAVRHLGGALERTRLAIEGMLQTHARA